MPRRVARSSSYNHAVISRIMLTFRPIAPKPAGGSADHNQVRGGNLLVGRRTKRKYVRVRGRTTKKQCVVRRMRKKPESKRSYPPLDNSEVVDPEEKEEVVTLQLLPERSETVDVTKVEEEDNRKTSELYHDEGEARVGGAGSLIQMWIIVERVTDKFTNNTTSGGGGREGLGFSDRERICDLEKDTCPGFVSDGRNSVIWVNEAYKRMVGGEQVAVGLVVKEELPHGCSSFACRVRLVEQRGAEEHPHPWNRAVVACDVWRMGFEGYAWKLDVSTALSLSLF